MLPVILSLLFAVIYIIGEAMNGWQKGTNYQNIGEIRRMQEEQEMREQYRLNMMRQKLEQHHTNNNKGDELND